MAKLFRGTKTANSGSDLTRTRTIRYTSPKRAKKAGQWAMKKYAKAFKKLAA